MMPDTSLVDYAGAIGTAIGAAVIYIATKRGERDKKVAPAPAPEFAGISATLVDRNVIVTLTEAVEKLTEQIAAQRGDEEMQRRVDERAKLETLMRLADEGLEKHRRTR